MSTARSLSSTTAADSIDAARSRFDRFAPVFAGLFPRDGWDGRIWSDLLDYPAPRADGIWLVKGDHELPMTGSIKARGGVHELLLIVERIVAEHGLDMEALGGGEARAILSRYVVVVASTGNLGYSIGIVGRAFGLRTEIHMSSDAKAWKKERLRAAGAELVEHDCDYSETIARARASAAGRADAIFIDDESSAALFAGYAVAADELAVQLASRGIEISVDRPLAVYLPCGVGGAPGGITWGLKKRFGAAVVAIWVEPVAAPCMMLALANGGGFAPYVYEWGCDNDTIADGLAVPRASELVLEAVGSAIDMAVAVTDEEMLEWLRAAWQDAGLKLEPSAAAALAAFSPCRDAWRGRPGWPDWRRAVHVFWATGGSQMPEEEFRALLAQAA